MPHLNSTVVPAALATAGGRERRTTLHLRRCVFSALVAAVGLAAAASPAPAGAFFTLEPKATFLHAATADAALGATALDLETLGVAPGARIGLRRLGDYDNGPGADAFTGMIAIFSSSATLLGPGNLHRVPDAIDAGVDVLTAPTFFGGEPTDVPEDFVVSSGDFPGGEICVVVPQGATHLFVCTSDTLYEDNSDPDGDWGFELSLLSGCAADLDESGAVDGGDLGTLLAGWGSSTAIGGSGDLDCDGDVDGGDLGLLLSAWGPC